MADGKWVFEGYGFKDEDKEFVERLSAEMDSFLRESGERPEQLGRFWHYFANRNAA
jgi:hypothetical protein